MLLILCPVAFVGLITWLITAFGGVAPTWLIVLIPTVGAMLGRFVLSRIAVAHLRQFYSDYVQQELRHEVV
jgi:hypothetical protein